MIINRKHCYPIGPMFEHHTLNGATDLYSPSARIVTRSLSFGHNSQTPILLPIYAKIFSSPCYDERIQSFILCWERSLYHAQAFTYSIVCKWNSVHSKRNSHLQQISTCREAIWVETATLLLDIAFHSEQNTSCKAFQLSRVTLYCLVRD